MLTCACAFARLQQGVIAAAGGLPRLLALLGSSEAPRQEAAVDALAALTADNTALVQQLAASGAAGPEGARCRDSTKGN